ncbi:kinase-like protein [Xylariaceae sp. AK1471]|nr:kinase-like protein [Xylariaceae sp. AK1471]
MDASRQLEAYAKYIQHHFETARYWEYEKKLGSGSYGMAVLLKQKGTFGGLLARQRMAVKFALPLGVRELQEELKWLKRLGGARHIVRMLASCDDLAKAVDNRKQRSSNFARRVLARFQRLGGVPPKTAFDSLAGLQGPAVALEYLENGDLYSLTKKLENRKRDVPNRILWSVFLCLVRACIGMAYPIGRPEGTPSILETIPTDGTQPLNIVHRDIAARNIMVGPGEELKEHHIGHLFKLIDFGAAREDVEGGRGPPSNLFDIGEAMALLIGRGQITGGARVIDGHRTRAAPLMLRTNGTDPYPFFDMELRELIARCMRSNVYQRPSLQEALNITQNAVLTKTPSSFPKPSRETDAAISGFLQEFIYDADP